MGNGTVSGTALYRVAGFPALSVAGILDVAKGAVGPVLAGGRPWAPPRPPTGWVAAVTRSAVPDARLRALALHACAPDVAEELHDRLTGLGADGVLVGGFGPVMVVHTGPGPAGIAWWWEPA
ncbi:MAG: hypothetical protein FJW77_08100 [Actinobacteria bacterium]|nr:hypothetical protein [Actinomycetota bacterium]